MEIREVTEEKKRYLSLLLIADEQESMIDRYLDRGTMFILDDGGIKGECVVTDEGNGILEIKNLAIEPACHRMGYGKALINYVAARYRGQYSVLQVGTGDSPLTIPFYEKCGFIRSHKVRNFFTENYDHPIYEGGVMLTDMIYLQRELSF
ncbi:MAG: GNAT family N-acetyltransferase [Lawsonibacter sp.]|nr:GNAT family N-acetyltransferase [Lawsonibacter sp.]